MEPKEPEGVGESKEISESIETREPEEVMDLSEPKEPDKVLEDKEVLDGAEGTRRNRGKQRSFRIHRDTGT
ncbi:MAG: hypothetical protein ACYSWZ_19510 [Planctomycetota bacterium]